MRTILLCFCMLISMLSYGQTIEDKGWATTWGTSPEYTGEGDMPKTTLSGKTIRQIIRPSIGGDTIRLRLSNFHSDEPVEIKSIYISNSIDKLIRNKKTGRGLSANGTTPNIISGTSKYITFKGDKSVRIEPYKNVTSDVIRFKVLPYRNIAITITYGEKTPKHATSHRGSRTTSFIAEGEVGPNDSLIVTEKVQHWYNILSLDVKDNKPVIAVLGNSITDGRGSTTDGQNRWTDQMAFNLGLLHSAKNYSDNERATVKPLGSDGCGVVNLGIGGNCVLEGGISDPLIKRYKDELSFHSGITHLIIYEGTNDIGTSTLPPDELAKKLIDAYKEIISYAKGKGIKVYMATITPTKGNGWYSKEHEKARKKVNKWIRSGKGFDGVVDFDKIVRDPSDPEKLRAEYSDDWLHLNPDGYKAMGEFASTIIGKALKLIAPIY